MIGAAGGEAYVEAEFDLPDDETLGELAELRPEGEDDARGRAADLRRRAHPRLRVGAERRPRGRRRGGRGAARDERPVRAAPARAPELPARRARRVRRERRAARRGAPGLARARGGAPRARASCTPRRGRRRGAARRAARARRRHATGSSPAARRSSRRRARAAPPRRRARGAASAPRSRRSRPRRATGAADLVAEPPSGRSRRSSELAPELAAAARGARRGRARAARGRLRAARASSPRSRPTRAALEQVEAELDRIADLRRRYRRRELRRAARPRRGRTRRARGARARAPTRPAAAAEALARGRGERSTALHGGAARRARREAAPRFGEAVAAELAGVGLGEGEFRVELRRGRAGRRRAPTRSSSRSGRTAGCRSRPVAETASGGELSRIALAIAAVAGGETMVFDEIDAGIGGTTAHAVGETLRRLAERAQVITITHLPQIASLADRHFRVEKVPGDPTHTRIERARRRRAPRGARADARRRRVPGPARRRRGWLAPRASCSRRRTRSGASSPSRTTSPTGGPAIVAVEPDRRGFAPARAGGSCGAARAACSPVPGGGLLGPARSETLVIVELVPASRWSWQPASRHARRARRRAALAVTVELARLAPARTRLRVEVASRGLRLERPPDARAPPLERLHALVQTAAEL